MQDVQHNVWSIMNDPMHDVSVRQGIIALCTEAL